MIDGYVSSAKALIDIIKDISSLNLRSTEGRFERVIEPIFENIKLVVDDYLDIMHEALCEIEASGPNVSPSSIALIRVHRAKLVVTRIEIRSLVSELQRSSHYRPYGVFLKRVDAI